jgi:hypothetical protein
MRPLTVAGWDTPRFSVNPPKPVLGGSEARRRTLPPKLKAAALAASYRRFAPFAHAALVTGSAGIVVTADGGQPASVMAFTFAAGKITEIYILADRSRLTRLGLARPGNGTGRTQ